MAQCPAIHINLSSGSSMFCSPYSKREVRRECSLLSRAATGPRPSCQPGGRQRQPHFRWLLAGIECSRRTDRSGSVIRRRPGDRRPMSRAPSIPRPPQMTPKRPWHALVLGTRDYVRKCGFKKVLIALSGGIDSALVAAIAVEALGRKTSSASACPARTLLKAPSTTRELGGQSRHPVRASSDLDLLSKCFSRAGAALRRPPGFDRRKHPAAHPRPR